MREGDIIFVSSQDIFVGGHTDKFRSVMVVEMIVRKRSKIGNFRFGDPHLTDRSAPTHRSCLIGRVENYGRGSSAVYGLIAGD